MIPLMGMAMALGFGMAQRTSVVASAVDRHEIGVASAVLQLGRNIAGAFGIALFGTLLNNRISSNVYSIGHYTTVHSSDPSIIAKAIGLIELKAQVAAYAYVFQIAGAIVFLGSFTILFMKIKHEVTDVKVHVE
jgi:uncharacterized membrane protein YgdD (TMEM256/DUF423 family)